MLDLDTLLTAALAEDVGSQGDLTSLAIGAAQYAAVGRCIIKDTGVLAGVQWAEKVYSKIDTSVKFVIHKVDGEACRPGDVAFEVYANAYTLLIGERLVLNLLQRLSGIATRTRASVEAAAGTGCEILATRKTTPLWRALGKRAGTIGRGTNHRFGPFDPFVIGDNHLALAPRSAPRISRVIAYRTTQKLTVPVVVEVRNLREIHEALAYAEHLDRLLLDNLTPAQVARAVDYIGGRLPVEVSGGITPENARAYAEAGARYLSAGSITHSVRALDLSLKIRPL